jgi:AraC-like DNA-binding protein
VLSDSDYEIHFGILQNGTPPKSRKHLSRHLLEFPTFLDGYLEGWFLSLAQPLLILNGMKAKTVRILRWLSAVVLIVQGGCAEADNDTSGSAAFSLHSDEEVIFDGFGQVPDNTEYQEVTGTAFLSSDASDFGSGGVLIWVGFTFAQDREGFRHGSLLMDLDLAGADHGGFLGNASTRVYYLERYQSRYMLEANMLAGEIRIVSEQRSENGVRLEIAFSLILGDQAEPQRGCRVLLDGRVLTRPAPKDRRKRAITEDDVIVETGCGGAEWDDDWDDWDDDWGFEGDTFDDDEDDDWEGDTFDDDEAGLSATGDVENGHAAGPDPIVATVADGITTHSGQISMDQVVQRSGLSARQLRRRFMRGIGVGPKLFSQILRFREMVHRTHRLQTLDWADCALEVGYFDQAHMINEFRRFAGRSPNQHFGGD